VDEIDDVWTVFLRVQIFIFFVLAVLFILGAVLVVLLYRAGLIPFSWDRPDSNAHYRLHAGPTSR